MRQKPFMILAASALFAALVGCGAPPLKHVFTLPVNEGAYWFYTGSKRCAGDYYLRIHELEHPKTGLTVVLVPMIHCADASFYREVQEEMDRADCVLMEGVRGAVSCGPTGFFTRYILSNSLRGISHTGLVWQAEGLKYRPNWRNGDLTYAEFQARMPWWTPFAHTVLFPFVVVLFEPMEAALWLTELSYDVAGRGDTFEAISRHTVAQSLDKEDDTMLLDRIFLPGALTERNEHLIEEFDTAAQEPGMMRIAIPWGAAHMKGIEAALVERGYETKRLRWIRAISLTALLTGGLPDAERPFDFKIPYLVHLHGFGAYGYCSLLLDTIEWQGSPTGYKVDLLWDLLLCAYDTPGEATLQVLPSFFGRPLLFEWLRRGEETRLRFLLFFEVNDV